MQPGSLVLLNHEAEWASGALGCAFWLGSALKLAFAPIRGKSHNSLGQRWHRARHVQGKRSTRNADLAASISQFFVWPQNCGLYASSMRAMCALSWRANAWPD